MRWRFGGDLGTNSLGWAVIELNADGRPVRITEAGSRIFTDGRDPKSKASLAADRRLARAMRRRRDRFKQRQAALLKYLEADGLFPTDDVDRQALERLNPYELRARALNEKLTLHEIGRALFHLNQRRGFKSNRKADRGKNDESGKVKTGVNRLYAAMQDEGARTLGEYLHSRRAKSADANAIASVRTRLRPETGENAKGDGYDFYPDRAMLDDEFNAIWRAQAAHHPDVLTDKVGERLHEIVFHQRPLKKPVIGKCTLLGSEDRLPKAHPLFQERRLLEELNALRIVRAGQEALPLTLRQRDALYLALKDKKSVTFKSLRKVLKLDDDARFNKESENRADLAGDEVAAVMGHKDRFGKRWMHLSRDTQADIVTRILDQESDDSARALAAWLESEHGLTSQEAWSLADAHLPEGYGRFGETATRKLIDALRAEVIVYSDAVKAAGFHHSDFRTGEAFDALPYYGAVLERHIMPGSGHRDEKNDEKRIGKLTNPTVHIGLNQLRQVMNDLIKRYGPPAECALELARDLKLNEQRKKEANTRNKTNRDDALARGKKLEELGFANKGGNRVLLKLWEELNRDNVLDRRCIYTGTQISIEMLFSGAVEIDHILPFSQTLDDSGGNLLLCTREANRIKRKRTPFEAFGHAGDWEAIASRAARLPKEKRWRFEPDALSRFDKEGGFLARQLTDTQHLSRLAREYLSALYPHKGEGSSHVWVSPGRLTEMLRRSWGLNSLLPDHNLAGGAEQPKNRRDHRHHAIDAIVIAVTDRGLLQRIARESAAHDHQAAERATAALPEPWDDFRDSVGAAVRRIVVSHRVDHGTLRRERIKGVADSTAARLHNDTAYGLTGRKDAKGNDIVVRRKPLDALKSRDDIEGVRDDVLRRALLDWVGEREGKDFEARLREFPKIGLPDYHNIRRVRVTEPLSVIPIKDKTGKIYKAYKGDSNFRYDVWELNTGKWLNEVVSMFDAHQPGWSSQVRAAHPTARKVLSLKQNDGLAIERAGEIELVRVVKFSEGSLALAPLNESGSLKARDADKSDPFKYIYASPSALKSWKARQIRIDRLGRVSDPGFPARKARRKTEPRPLRDAAAE